MWVFRWARSNLWGLFLLFVAANVVVWFVSALLNEANKLFPLSPWAERVETAVTVESHEDCKVTERLGAWLRLSCAGGALEGMLAGVSGDAREIEAASVAFEAFHAEPLACSRALSGTLSCQAGDADLSEHLARHGFAEPARAPAAGDSDLVGVQTWVATLLGFVAAVAAFVFRAEETRLHDEKERARLVVSLKSRKDALVVELNRVVGHTSREEESKDARAEFKSLAEECCDFLQVFLAEPAFKHDAEALQQTLRAAAKDVDDLRPKSDKSQIEADLTLRVNKMVTVLDT